MPAPVDALRQRWAPELRHPAENRGTAPAGAPGVGTPPGSWPLQLPLCFGPCPKILWFCSQHTLNVRATQVKCLNFRTFPWLEKGEEESTNRHLTGVGIQRPRSSSVSLLLASSYITERMHFKGNSYISDGEISCKMSHIKRAKTKSCLKQTPQTPRKVRPVNWCQIQPGPRFTLLNAIACNMEPSLKYT